MASMALSTVRVAQSAVLKGRWRLHTATRPKATTVNRLRNPALSRHAETVASFSSLSPGTLVTRDASKCSSIRPSSRDGRLSAHRRELCSAVASAPDLSIGSEFTMDIEGVYIEDTDCYEATSATLLGLCEKQLDGGSDIGTASV
eukprot:4213660-Pyramimonas_sp.AAC.1